MSLFTSLFTGCVSGCMLFDELFDGSGADCIEGFLMLHSSSLACVDCEVEGDGGVDVEAGVKAGVDSDAEAAVEVDVEVAVEVDGDVEVNNVVEDAIELLFYWLHSWFSDCSRFADVR